MQAEHSLLKITSFAIVAPYTLDVKFDDSKIETINFEPVLEGYYYTPLRDVKVFNSVRIDPDAHTLFWSNGADFAPETLYHWHDGDGDELARKVARWEHQVSHI